MARKRIVHHYKTMHNSIPPGVKVFNCDQCEKVYYNGHDLKKHIKGVHEGNKIYQKETYKKDIVCEQCSETFVVSNFPFDYNLKIQHLSRELKSNQIKIKRKNYLDFLSKNMVRARAFFSVKNKS